MVDLVHGLSDAWAIAKQYIEQKRQKTNYDRHAKDQGYRVGDRVMVHMPHEFTGKAWKLARPYFGPYRILSVTPTNAAVRLVDKPDEPSIFVSLSRVRPCYSEISDTSWSGHKKKKRKKKKKENVTPSVPSTEVPYTGPITLFRSQQSKNSGT